MKYSHHYQVKWHDTDANREVRPSQILMYMQETANLQLKDAGMSLDALRDEKGLAFLLSRVSVRIYEPLYAHDEIDVQTWICDSVGFSFNRCFAILKDGRIVAEATSIWALMDLNTERLCRAQSFEYPFDGDEQLRLDLPTRVRFSAETPLRKLGEREIRYSDIDYNGHMNNTRYPDMLCDFLPNIRDKRVVGYTLSYLREAKLGHSLTAFCAEQDVGTLFRMVDSSDGAVCLEALLLTEERTKRQNG